jgi:hypothetical protein
MDGYPTTHGAELKELLGTFRLVKGLSEHRHRGRICCRGIEEPRLAVGMPCLAAQVVSHFKADEPGRFYLQPPDCFELPPSFRYSIYIDDAGILSLRCEVPEFEENLASQPPREAPARYSWHTLYDGPVNSFDPDEAERWAFE